MSAPLDLGPFVQRRQLRSYEQDLARSVYAYGVDVRRFQWLSHSLAAQTALRALDLRWIEHAETLMAAKDLGYPEGAESLQILQEIIQVAELLHTCIPGIRLVTSSGRDSGRWPLVAPLANSRGGDPWLVVDHERLAQRPPPARAFLLAQGLGHLQCGHGGLFMAHLVSAHDRVLHDLVRHFLAPWRCVAAFSADRAGLLAAGDLPSALATLADPGPLPAWLPEFSPARERERALQEFDRSRVAMRVRSHQQYRRERSSLVEIVEALHADPNESADSATPPPTFEVPPDAWPLARCDQRLTQRLGLL